MAKKLEEPAGNASTEAWQAYAAQQDPDNAATIAETGRDELRERYGPPAEHAPVAADPTPDELAHAVDVTPEAQAAQAVAAEQEAAAAELPERVRLLPADWTVNGVMFPYGEPEEGSEEPPILHVNRTDGGLEVDAEEADDIIAAAGSHGFALQKESVA